MGQNARVDRGGSLRSRCFKLTYNRRDGKIRRPRAGSRLSLLAVFSCAAWMWVSRGNSHRSCSEVVQEVSAGLQFAEAMDFQEDDEKGDDDNEDGDIEDADVVASATPPAAASLYNPFAEENNEFSAIRDLRPASLGAQFILGIRSSDSSSAPVDHETPTAGSNAISALNSLALKEKVWDTRLERLSRGRLSSSTGRRSKLLRGQATTKEVSDATTKPLQTDGEAPTRRLVSAMDLGVMTRSSVTAPPRREGIWAAAYAEQDAALAEELDRSIGELPFERYSGRNILLKLIFYHRGEALLEAQTFQREFITQQKLEFLVRENFWSHYYRFLPNRDAVRSIRFVVFNSLWSRPESTLSSVLLAHGVTMPPPGSILVVPIVLDLETDE